MSLQLGQVCSLRDGQGLDLGQVAIERVERDLVFGRFTPGPNYRQVESLFAEYVAAANNQLLSAVAQLGERISALGLCLRSADGAAALAIFDVQIGDGAITFHSCPAADLESIQAVEALSRAIRRLRDLGVIRSRRFTGDLGEWYVKTLCEGELCRSQTQKGWDIRLPNDDQRLQVKTQSFDPQNRWNYRDTDPALFDRLILVVLTDDLTIKALYDVPSAKLGGVLRVGKEQRRKYYFADLEPWRADVSSLPGFQRLAKLVEPEARRGQDAKRPLES